MFKKFRQDAKKVNCAEFDEIEEHDTNRCLLDPFQKRQHTSRPRPWRLAGQSPATAMEVIEAVVEVCGTERGSVLSEVSTPWKMPARKGLLHLRQQGDSLVQIVKFFSVQLHLRPLWRGGYRVHPERILTCLYRQRCLLCRRGQ